MTRKKWLYFTCLMLMFAWATPSRAIEPPLLVKPKSPAEPGEVFTPPAAGDEKRQDMTGQVESHGDRVIEAIHFVGGTSLDLTLIARDVQFLIGQPFQKDLVQIAIDKVSQRFHANGYPLAFATIGRNGFNRGKLTITVVEGYVIRSEIIVSSDAVKDKIQQILADLLEEKPTRQETLERAIALITHLPGYQFSLSLPRPKTLSGATSIRIEQKNRDVVEPFVGYAMQQDSDNNMSLGLRMNINRSYLETLTLNALLPVDDHDQQFYSVQLTHAPGGDGLLSSLALIYYRDGDEGVIPVSGEEVAVENRIERISADYGLSYPFILNQHHRLTATLGLLYEEEQREYRLSYQDMYLGQLDDTIRYLIASLAVSSLYQQSDFLVSVGFAVHQSIPATFDYSSDLGQSRLYDDSFRFYQMNLLSSYQLTSRYLVSARADGMYASESIVPSQRVSYGGVNFGRGYPEGALEGDRGYGAELKLMQQNRHKKFSFNPFILVDYAYAEQKRIPLAYNELSSAAIGVETNYGQALHVSVDYARPLREHQRFTRAVYNLSLRWKF